MEKVRFVIVLLFEPINLALATLASLLRPWTLFGRADLARPKTPLKLYEFENCPYCRVTREAISATGTEVEIYPCPKGGERFRPYVKEAGGKAQFPYLVDEGASHTMYESADIARRLAKDRGVRLWWLWLGPISIFLSMYTTFVRLFWGMRARSSASPDKLLALEGREGSPMVRLARELLCEMEIAYAWRPVGWIPRLTDPNTGAELRGDLAIRRYLMATYRA